MSKAVKLSIAAGCGCLVLPAVIGILAAIALPAFTNYIKRSKAVEARSNLAGMVNVISTLLEYESSLPPALPLTPSNVPCGSNSPWPADAATGWSDLGFMSGEPVFYSLEYTPAPDGNSYVVRARGDLDCDGVEAVYEITARRNARGGFEAEPIVVTNELE